MATAKERQPQLTPVTAPMVAQVADPVRQFGKYFLVRKLAEGGMAEIFLAKLVGAEGFERDVVIKRMLKHLSSISDFVNMFLDEAKLAARLVHPNVIQINELGQADGCFFICMEYLPGEDFSTVVRTAGRKREYVPFHVVARVIADAARGLNFAHEFTDNSGKGLGIVHRDVSPSNIYVTYQGTVKVLDFGIAKAESRVTNTTAGVVKGKYMYMAPEQARGTAVDRRADVFSLGVSLYEALTHYRPFSRENDLAILNAVLKCDFRPPRELRKDLPVELEAIILKAMAAKAEDRYQSAGDMANDLEKYVSMHVTDSGSQNVGSYLRALFGDERVVHRTRIPSLTELASAGVQVPGYTPDAKTTTAPKPGGQSDPAVPIVRSRAASGERSSTGSSRPRDGLSGVRRKGGGAGLLAVGVMLGLMAFGGAFLALRLMPGSAPAQPLPAPVLAQPAPAEPTSAPPAPAETPAPVPPAPVAQAPAPPPPAPEPDEPDEPRGGKRRRTAPIHLDALGITKVVRQQSSPIVGCFNTYKEDLTDLQVVQAKFTILGTGRVSAATVVGSSGPLTARVSKCVEDRVAKMRFPAHVDKEITITVPFQYHLAHAPGSQPR